MKLRKTSAPVAIAILLLIAGVPLGGVPLWILWQQRHREQMRSVVLPVTMRQAEPIVTAIHHYVQQHHVPPSTLEALVPRYLTRLPDAGPAALDGWHYTVTSPEITAHWAVGDWTLSVQVRQQYSPNIVFGFGDTFVLHSSGQYPQTGYGGGLWKQIGKWGYYVE